MIGLQETRSRTFDWRMLPDDIGTFPITESGCEWDALIEAESRIARFFPALNEARFESYMAGLSAYTPDGHFILGGIDGIPGLFVAAGCCGSGVMASGGIGDALARLVMTGESPYDLSPFKPGRFGKLEQKSSFLDWKQHNARSTCVWGGSGV